MAEEGEGPAIGIDFGMSNARVGVWLHGGVEIISNEDGSRATPSFVAFTDAECLVGQAAKDYGIIDPTKVSFGAKRFLDAKYDDDSSLTDFNDRGNNSLQQFSAEQISTFILTKLRSAAERFLNIAVKDAVIAVPSYFNTFQRHAIKDAATDAGLNLIRIVSEPSAAAIAYASNGVAGNVLVFDLGGGCFGVSILTIHGNGSWIEVKANAGDVELGGEEFDNRMLAYFVEEFKKLHKGKDIGLDPRALWRLKTACEDAKKSLSVAEWVSMEIPALYQGIDYVLAITRSRFEELNRDLLGRCMLLVEKCLREAALDKRSIDHVVLVGGSSKIPRVATLLHSLFDGKELLTVIDPEEAVACGASILAHDIRRQPGAPPRLSELTTASIGLEHWGGMMSVVIPRNTRFPGKWKVPIVAVHDRQQLFHILVYESEASHTKRGNLLGILVFKRLHPVPMGVPKLLACLELDANGILGLVAEDLESGKRKTSIISKDMLHKRFNKEAPRCTDDDDPPGSSVGHKKYLESYCCRLEEATRNIVAADDKKQIRAAAWRAMASANGYYFRKSDIIRMILEAEKRQVEREERKKLVSKNTLERCCIGLKNFLNDVAKTTSTPLPSDTRTAEGATERMIRWLDDNQLAEAFEYSDKMNELGRIYSSIGVELTDDDTSSWLMKMLQRPTC